LTTPDPITTNHPYTYVNSNPTNNTDPTGYNDEANNTSTLPFTSDSLNINANITPISQPTTDGPPLLQGTCPPSLPGCAGNDPIPTKTAISDNQTHSTIETSSTEESGGWLASLTDHLSRAAEALRDAWNKEVPLEEDQRPALSEYPAVGQQEYWAHRDDPAVQVGTVRASVLWMGALAPTVEAQKIAIVKLSTIIILPLAGGADDTAPTIRIDGSGTAKIHLWESPGNKHFSVETNFGGRTIHTELLPDATGGTTIWPWDSSKPNGALTATVPFSVPDAYAAQIAQTRLIGKNGPALDLLRYNCLTHCADVLRAGKVPGVPLQNRTPSLVSWLQKVRFEQANK
ncbi:hypothetical protein ACIPJS_37340, partial [Streptomyces sp. NPDC086783]|uniref:hypothetical protein n=1 Tax=Streptomyces sp. NPDC086783 TaxID=3365758 RepID=UPI0038284DBD